MTPFLTIFPFVAVIPYALVVLMPNWRWWSGITLVGGVLISAVWIQDAISVASPSYHDGNGFGHLLGVILFSLLTIGFATGVAIRGVTLMMKSRQWPRSLMVATNVFGLALVPAIAAAPSALQNWKMRPAAESCISGGFQVLIADAHLSVPVSPIFTIYRGESVRRDAYYFFSNSRVRELCSLSESGKMPFKATHVGMNFEHNLKTFCNGDHVAEKITACSARGIKSVFIDKTDFPINLQIFSPDEVNMGEFLGSRSSFLDSNRSYVPPHVFFKAEMTTPDSNPLTFDCTEQPNDYWCRASYPWQDGIFINYAFRAKLNDVLAKGHRIDNTVRQVLAHLQARN